MGKGRDRTAVRSLTAALILVAVGGLSTGAPSADIATPIPAAPLTSTIGPYQQTWTAPYGATSCEQWHATMDAHERFVAAGDMLVASRANGRIPTDA